MSSVLGQKKNGLNILNWSLIIAQLSDETYVTEKQLNLNLKTGGIQTIRSALFNRDSGLISNIRFHYTHKT